MLMAFAPTLFSNWREEWESVQYLACMSHRREFLVSASVSRGVLGSERWRKSLIEAKHSHCSWLGPCLTSPAPLSRLATDSTFLFRFDTTRLTMSLPEFYPSRWIPSGHLQTVVAAFWPQGKARPAWKQHVVALPDGDELILHDDLGDYWKPGDPCTLLVHGLCGCHASRYMLRIARKLNQRGRRTFRIDLRGCGAGKNRAKHPYHAGRSEDVEAALAVIRQICPRSPLSVIGFSLGGNIVLKWAGEAGADSPAMISSLVAVNPPVDLVQSSRRIARAARGLYDRHFCRLLMQQIQGTRQWTDEAPLAKARNPPRSLREFDDLFTAPLSGFSGVDDYYRRSSSCQFVPDISIPTLILTSRDDPLIPYESIAELNCPAPVRIHLVAHGGHLGYLARSGHDPDRHWMDWRIIDWLTATPSP